MRVFVIAAMGAVALAGCAPFQHGHYSEDVSYLNSHGDPAGTPLVYQSGLSQSTQVAQTSYSVPTTDTVWSQPATTYSNSAFGAGGFPTTTVAQQPIQHSQPVSYAPPTARSYNLEQASVVVPTVSSPITYAPAVQQAYVPPVSVNVVPTVQAVAPPPRQTIVRAAPQPIPQRISRASYVAPRVAKTVLATSYSGPKLDADGYAICDIPWPGHAAHETPALKVAPASHVARTAPQPLLRF